MQTKLLAFVVLVSLALLAIITAETLTVADYEAIQSGLEHGDFTSAEIDAIIDLLDTIEDEEFPPEDFLLNANGEAIAQIETSNVLDIPTSTAHDLTASQFAVTMVAQTTMDGFALRLPVTTQLYISDDFESCTVNGIPSIPSLVETEDGAQALIFEELIYGGETIAVDCPAVTLALRTGDDSISSSSPALDASEELEEDSFDVAVDADGQIVTQEARIIITPTFYKTSSNSYDFTFEISAYVDMDGFALRLPPSSNLYFAGDFSQCTVNGVDSIPTLIATDEEHIETSQALVFDEVILAGQTYTVTCVQGSIESLLGTEVQPELAEFTFEGSGYSEDGKVITYTSTSNIHNSLPRFTWFTLLLICLGAGLLACGAIFAAFIVYKKRTSIGNKQKLLDLEAEKAKPEEKQSLLSSPDQPFVSIV